MKFDWVPEDRKSLMKRIMILSIIAVAAILLYLWHEAIGDFFGKCIKVLKPLLYAIVIAYILWPMLRFFETKVFAGLEKKKPNKKLVRFLSLLVTYTIFLLILVLFLSMVIPQIAESVTSLIALASGYISNIQDWFMNISPETPVIGPLIDTELFVELRGTLIGYLKDAVEWLTGNLKNIMDGATDYAKETWSIVLGVIFGVYFLLFKENLFAQITKLMHASMKEKTYDRVVHYVKLTDRTFGGFISGKLLDSLIIGILCFLIMTIFRMPYASLISMIIGITNVIPFFGPLIGAIPSAFFIFIAENTPAEAVGAAETAAVSHISVTMTLWFILMVVLLQQLDGNVIGPKILGDFVGLNSLWIIISITVMGGFFGLFGMFFGVPTFAVIYAVVKELTEKKLAVTGKPTETGAYYADPAYEEIVRKEPKEPGLPKFFETLAGGVKKLVRKIKDKGGNKS